MALIDVIGALELGESPLEAVRYGWHQDKPAGGGPPIIKVGGRVFVRVQLNRMEQNALLYEPLDLSTDQIVTLLGYCLRLGNIAQQFEVLLVDEDDAEEADWRDGGDYPGSLLSRCVISVDVIGEALFTHLLEVNAKSQISPASSTTRRWAIGDFNSALYAFDDSRHLDKPADRFYGDLQRTWADFEGAIAWTKTLLEQVRRYGLPHGVNRANWDRVTLRELLSKKVSITITRKRG